ncbi:MAG: GreA/GreB family elongation factor [Candidatus Saccharibacteria bacterium]
MQKIKEISVTKVDYSRLNALILQKLDDNSNSIRDLNHLNIEIKRAQKVDSKKISPDIITMDSQVRITFLNNNQSRIVRLVYPEKASLKDGHISVLSPLGCALLGYRKGDIVSFNTPGGIQTVKIDMILFQPEAHGLDLD